MWVLVEWIKMNDLAMELLVALKAQKLGTCWCEVAIGNPNLRGRHTSTCDLARLAVSRAENEFAALPKASVPSIQNQPTTKGEEVTG